MSRKNLLLLCATHLIALGVAYAVAKNEKPAADPSRQTKPARTKSTTRNSRLSDGGDGAELLAAFKNEQSESKSRYEELKATLPMARDLKAAAVEALAKWQANPTDEKTLAEMKVRMLHWLKQNPMEAMDFIVTESGTAPGFDGLPTLLTGDVLMEVVAEKGELQSLPWLTKSAWGATILHGMTVEEMKAGGGFALFLKLDAAMKGDTYE